MHHERIHVTMLRMLERERQVPYDVEAQRLPEPNHPFICADDEIELHGAITTHSGVVKRMKAHLPRYTSASCMCARHIAAVTDVFASASLIRTHVVGAED